MKIFFLNFHYYNCFIYIFIILFFYILKDIKKNRIKLKLKEEKNRIKILKKYKIPILIALCGLLDFSSSIDYSYYYSYELKKIDNLVKNIDSIFFIIFLCLTENYFLNIQNYTHHYLGLFFCIISLILLIFNNFIQLFKCSFDLLLFILILYFENGIIDTIQVLLEKKLNNDYYVNVYYLCFLEGTIDLICLIILYPLIYFISKDYFALFINKNFYEKNNLKYFIFIIIDILLCFVYNLSRLKISEKNRPSYNSIANLLYFIFLNIYKSIFENEKIWTINFILHTIFALLGCFIFCEVITLNFCNLDKNTFDKTSMRSKIEINSLVNDSALEIV